MAKIITVQTPPVQSGVFANSEFTKNKIDSKLWDKGYDVIWEKGVQCPCKTKGHDHLSTCENCGSTGWIFLNKHQTRMLLYSMSVNRKFEVWTMQDQGTIHITALHENQLTFMDRITVLDAFSVHNQTLYPKQLSNGQVVGRSIYEIEEIEYIAVFSTALEPLQRLKLGIDYSISKNFIIFNNSFKDKTVTIRYKHRPQFHVIDILRETMNSRTTKSGRGVQDEFFPIHAIGKRSHFVLDAENFSGTKIIDNSYGACEIVNEVLPSEGIGSMEIGSTFIVG